MIEARGLTKLYGDKRAVDDLSFTVQPGVVTGFLGPNGAGKSTTMRMILGLDNPSAGFVRVNGKAYPDHRRPLQEVGALLEARAVHTGRSARNHLLAVAATAGISRERVDTVIELVGLSEVASRRVGSFSLGMGQRLGLATALLGDPSTLILDEPVNGLDPDGIRWIRYLLKDLAGEGRTIFLSSHLMSEMALTADHVIVVGKGRLLRDQPMSEFISAASAPVIRVRSPQLDALRPVLAAAGATITSANGDAVEVTGISQEQVGTVAAKAGVILFELSPQTASLEEAYMALTEDSLDFTSRSPSKPTTESRPAA